MRSLLFWKIFWNFWLTFLLQLVLMWAVFTFFMKSNPGLDRLVAERSAPQTIDLAARLVALYGPKALPNSLADGGVRISAVRLFPDAALDPRHVRKVTAPDGHTYRIAIVIPAVSSPGGIVGPEIYIVGLVTGLLSAASLAFYLARPIRILKTGFEAFASGELNIRLSDRVGHRRDEIADLARDFDGMASNIELLVRARDQLLDDVSHELRSPLARLQLAIALARQKEDRRGDALDRIEREAARLDAMVSELLTLSRLESGAPLIEGYFDLAALIEEVAADASFEGRPGQITIEVTRENLSLNEAVEMPGDPELIRRVFENIVRNALRFSPRPGVIGIHLRRSDNHAALTIVDEGPGVPPDQLATLFEPFVKAHPGGGWGLGLAIARRALIAHGGRIIALNGKNGGLHVSVELPLSTPSSH